MQEFILTVSRSIMHSIAKILKWKPQKDRGAFLASSEDKNWEALGSLETPRLLWCSTTCWSLQCVHFWLFLIIPKPISLSTKCFFSIFSFWQVIELIPGKDSQEVLLEQVLQILGKLHYYYYCYYLLVLVLIIFTVIFMAQYELPVPLCQQHRWLQAWCYGLLHCARWHPCLGSHKSPSLIGLGYKVQARRDRPWPSPAGRALGNSKTHWGRKELGGKRELWR